MIDSILWSKLKLYEVDKRRSFEELCYQVAQRLFGVNGIDGHAGEFVSIDDTGGGDGVEFYMTLPNGDQWGWQAKFFYPGKRLSEGGRKRQITKSLKVACEKHPNLKKWFLCTPTRFTQDKTTGNKSSIGEQTWFEQTLPKSVPTGMSVELVHWGESKFLHWFGKPEFTGLRHYFFGELELTLDWFRVQVDKQIDSLGEKYEEALHTDTRLDARVHRLLADDAYAEVVSGYIVDFNEQLEEYDQAVTKLRQCNPQGVEWASYQTNLLGRADGMCKAFLSAIARVKATHELLCQRQIQAVLALNFAPEVHDMRQARADYDAVWKNLMSADLVYAGKEEHREEEISKVKQSSFGPQECSSTLFGSLQAMFEQFQSAGQPDLHILGKAGIGKSHISAHICRRRIDAGMPTLLLRGGEFTSDDPLSKQMRDILDIPPHYSWNDFLQALSTAASVYGTRIPIVIDGLNEATNNGRLSVVWATYLAGLVTEIEKLKNVVLITTCRDTYKDAIWPETKPQNLLYSYGFNYDDVEIAIKKYFDAYKIKANFTAAPVEQFQHPIYLKIFCETQNPERQVEKRVYIGEQTLFEVFDAYLAQTNKAVCARLGLHSGVPIVRRALSEIAKYMWDERTRSIPINLVAQIADGKPLSDLTPYAQSKTKALQDEGLILCRDWADDGADEVIYFTYDLLGGYLIANYLVDKNIDGLDIFLRAEQNRDLLFSEDYSTLHPLYGDIRRAFAALLPVRMGRYLHEFTDDPVALGVSVEALFEIPPSAVHEKAVELLTQLFNIPQNREPLLRLSTSTVGHVGHPLNAPFWSILLRNLSMAERDESWTEYIRNNIEIFEKLVAQVEIASQDGEELDHDAEQRLSHLAEHLMWMLTSTVHTLRDKATRALYWYGRRCPGKFLDMLLNALSINDPYVPERMLAAAYGVCMARHYDFRDPSFKDTLLPLYGRKVYDAIFRLDAPFSTTHILSRDYARHIIEVAALHHPELLNASERPRIEPPFHDGGIRKWGKSKDRNKDQYREGNHPMFTLGDDDPMGWLGPQISKYHSESPEFKKAQANLWWRLYALGYSLERFGELDKRIARRSGAGYSKHQRSANTYGEKYRLIAAHELVGYRHDLGLLKHDYETEYDYLHERWSHVDIDPSFPVEPIGPHIIDATFLGDPALRVEEWILHGDMPDVEPYLSMTELKGEFGPWILLDGHFNQTNDEINRSTYINIRGLLVSVANFGHTLGLLRSHFDERDYYHDGPSDHYTFAGEIPWADAYPPNGEHEVSVRTNTHTVSSGRNGLVFYRDGTRVSGEEHVAVIRALSGLIEAGEDPNSKMHAFEAALSERGLTYDIETVSVEHEEYDYEDVLALAPVRSNNWESYHSTIAPSQDVATPARELTDHLQLCGQPQTYDLYDQTGKRASISVRSEEHYQNMEKLTYLRKDLLERYLTDTSSALIWIIFGAREYSSKDHHYRKFPKGYVHRKVFNQVIPYSPTS